MRRHTGLLILLSVSAGSSALLGQSQKDMIIQLQRDMATVQDQLKALLQKQDEKFTVVNDRQVALSTNLLSTLEEVRRLNATLAVTQATLNEKLGEITRNVSAPMNSIGSKVDGMADQFQSLSNSVADLNSRIGKLDAKVVELQKIMQTAGQTLTPPSSGGGTTPPGGSGTPPPADKIYEDAQRDFSAGNWDLALQGFQGYLHNYGTTLQAADAQFYIGEIFFRRDDFPGAVEQYDKVINNYSDSNRVPNARYMKGVSLLKMSRRSDAKKEFLTIIEKYPGNPLVPKAKDYLKVLGVNTSQAPAPTAAKKYPARKR